MEKKEKKETLSLTSIRGHCETSRELNRGNFIVLTVKTIVILWIRCTPLVHVQIVL